MCIRQTEVASDEEAMRLALGQARLAEKAEEVPAGAVILDAQRRLVAAAYNQTITFSDPTAHAEILALRQAAARIGNHRLLGVSVFSTLEPCPMCLMAMVHARVSRLVYGAIEPRTGACGSLISLMEAKGLNHAISIQAGLLASECQELIQSFFKKRRGTEVAVTGATRNRLVR